MTLSGRAGVVEEGVEGERTDGCRRHSAAVRARPLRCDSRKKVMMYVSYIHCTSLFLPFLSSCALGAHSLRDASRLVSSLPPLPFRPRPAFLQKSSISKSIMRYGWGLRSRT